MAWIEWAWQAALAGWRGVGANGQLEWRDGWSLRGRQGRGAHTVRPGSVYSVVNLECGLIEDLAVWLAAGDDVACGGDQEEVGYAHKRERQPERVDPKVVGHDGITQLQVITYLSNRPKTALQFQAL